MVQRRAARFVFKNYSRHVSVTALIKELGWSEPSSARKRDRLCMMFKIVNNLTPINCNDHLSYCKTVTSRNHPQKLNILAPRTDTYKFSCSECSKVHRNDKISTQRRFNPTVSHETYKHGPHLLTSWLRTSSAHARANAINYRGTVRTLTCK